MIVMKNRISNFLFPTITLRDLSFEVMYALFRIYCGVSIAYGAGLSKVYHKINPEGDESWSNLAFGVPEWFTKMVGGIGFTFISPSFWAHLAVYGEFIGGVLIALGLFTRLSAIQMAFQFFVVAFIWFDKPMPFAMYYQQLIFWSFALISVIGSGRFSLDNWIQSKRLSLTSGKTASIVILFVIGATTRSTAQTNTVAFIVKNTTLCSKNIALRYFNYETRTTTGYGLDLGPKQSEAVNMPIGTRIYSVTNGKEALLTIISSPDAGTEVQLSLEPTHEQWLQAAYDEQNEAAAKRLQPDPRIETLMAGSGKQMIPLSFSGKSLTAKVKHVRFELPIDGAAQNVGFTESLSQKRRKEVLLPVGTKVYLCDGAFWEAQSNEQLLFVVDAEKANYEIKI
jgi:uncharacterized membrane protein YphA (DoxX/SURF4 family)